eukprot:2801195-Pyramimonas_sp.AAC.1
MHLSRTHRIDVAAMSEHITRGVVDLQCERAQNDAADIGAERFTDSLAWVQVLTLLTFVLLSFGKSIDIRTIWHRCSLMAFP